MEGQTIIGATVVVNWTRKLEERLNGKCIHRKALQSLGQNQTKLRVIGEFRAKGKDCGSTYLTCRPLDPRFQHEEIPPICRDFIRIIVPAGHKEGPARKIRPARREQAIAQAY